MDCLSVFRVKTQVMRHLANLAARGYVHYTEGTAEHRAMTKLSAKVIDRYKADAPDWKRFRNKKAGKANTKLIMWLTNTNKIHWWILATEGEGLVHELEQLKDLRSRKQRVELTGYELVRVPRKEEESGVKTSAVRYTWRMTKEAESDMSERLKSSIRSGKHTELKQALWSLARVPGFHSSRRQAFKLQSQAKAEWKRTRSTKWPYPEIYSGYLGRYKELELIPLGELPKEASKGAVI